MSDLDVQLRITTASGTVDFSTGLYDLHTETAHEVQQTWRKREVSNEHLEGSYTIAAHRENQLVPVSIWVEHTNRVTLENAVEVLKAALSQLQYSVIWRVQGRTETWSCQPASWTEDRQQAYLHAGLVLIKAQVPRLPKVVIS